MKLCVLCVKLRSQCNRGRFPLTSSLNSVGHRGLTVLLVRFVLAYDALEGEIPAITGGRRWWRIACLHKLAPLSED